MQQKEYADIALGLPVRKPFHYRVPPSLMDKAEIGKRVLVPFGPRKLVGYIVGFVGRPDFEGVKDIISVIDQEGPVISPELLSLTKWISEYYHSSWGEAIAAALPGAIKKGKIKAAPRNPAPEDIYEATKNYKPTLEQASALKPIFG
ncbi:MAG: hypothetical protein WC324_04595, partial [Candidatus Omnitrophota bacterium]